MLSLIIRGPYFSVFLYYVFKMMRWRYWQGSELAIYNSLVRVLAGHHCVVALSKLLTPVRLCHQTVYTLWSKKLSPFFILL